VFSVPILCSVIIITMKTEGTLHS